MKRAAPSKESHPIRLLLHCEDGAIPYMTPFLMKKYVPPSDDLWLGIQVRDTCVVPLYKSDKNPTGKNNKPNGYTFDFKGLDPFLLEYNRVTVPSFNLLEDAAYNDSGKEPSGVPATDGYVQVWTPQGRHKLTPSLYSKAARGLQSRATVPLYDMAMKTESKKRKQTALRRNAMWLKEYIKESETGNSSVWALVVLGMDNEVESGVEQLDSDNLDGLAFVGQKEGIDLGSQLNPHLEQTSLCNNIVLLSARSTLELMDAARSGFNMIGTALPALWTKAHRAFVVTIDHSISDSSKRARIYGEETREELDEDGCLNLNDTRYARDSLPLMPGCTCMACSNSHSRAYIHHLVQAKELLAQILLFAHNLHHLRGLCRALSTDVEATYDAVWTRITTKNNSVNK